MLPAFSLCTCCRHYPGAASECMSLLTSPDVSAFPDRVVGSACAMSFSRLARRSLTLRPAHSPSHLVTFYIEGFSHFVTSMTASIASGWSKSCRVGLSPTGKRRLSTAHTPCGHTAMNLRFPIPAIHQVTLSTQKRHSSIDLSFPIPVIHQVTLLTTYKPFSIKTINSSAGIGLLK